MTDGPSDNSGITQWVGKADGDFTAATHLLGLPDDQCPFDVVCFHAQQCVEKYLKALLVAHGLAPPRTHDLAELLTLLAPRDRPLVTIAELGALTPYAVETRYPHTTPEPIDRREAAVAVGVARRAVAEIHARLRAPAE